MNLGYCNCMFPFCLYFHGLILNFIGSALSRYDLILNFICFKVSNNRLRVCYIRYNIRTCIKGVREIAEKKV
uniref:Putative ovule protein n=1 Tax=Solanum chacoense TaxID=4108 RepID=A0A0V0GPZ8_SOLCH